MSRRTRLAAFVVALIGVVLFGGARFNLSALDEPGPLETRLANAAKHGLVARTARSALLPEPAAAAVSTTVSFRSAAAKPLGR